VLFKLDYYLAHPDEIIMINNGGLAIYGGIIGALAGGCITAKIRKMKIMPLLDVTMLGFLIGQGIGRWGNFMNQEAFGSPTNLPWGMASEATEGITVHPCFLYESLWCLLGFVLLHFYSKKFQKYGGQIFYMYLVWYGFERMIVEGLRTDSLYLPFKIFSYDIRVSQALSFCIFITGIVFLIVNRNKEDNFYADYRRKKSISSGESSGSSAGEGVTE
jgi:phosphatidylglycerol:prolipoprotein diacylglycerol transferase